MLKSRTALQLLHKRKAGEQMNIQRLGLLLHQSDKRFKKYLDRELMQLKLTSKELAVIMDLHHQKKIGSDQSRTLTIMATRLEIDLKSFEAIIEKMEKNDWIVRVPGQVDRRSLDIFLSSKSQSIIDYLADRYQNVVDKACDGLSKEEIEDVERILTLVVENLEL